MANRIMYRQEAEKYLHENGYKLFLDLIIKDKIVVFDKEPHSEEYVKGYRKGFYDHAYLNFKVGTEVMLLGYSVSQLIDIIQAYEIGKLK